MVIPSGPSTTTAPIPHPFIGKITDEISDDVKIKDKGVATKGSKAKHDDSMHMQLPGTIQFQNSPKCEGEVTGGTGTKVKVNGKEVAVIGSQVTTCNDMGMQNNSTIIAAGLSIPMPMILNPKNTEEFERDEKEQENKNPKFKNVKWSVTSVEEDEEAELSACVEDICDGNMVTLQVFREGKGPENSDPMAQFPLIVKDGKVSAKWKYHADHTEPAPDQNPKFIFSAHSAWCNFEKSSNSLEVKLIRPEITSVEWQDADGKGATKALVGDKLKLVAQTKDMQDGEGVTFFIYDHKNWEVANIGATVKGGKAEAEWYAVDKRYSTDKKELGYTFVVKSLRTKIKESDKCTVKNPQVLSMEWDKKAIYYGDKATLKIQSFELSDEKPSCKLQFWEKDYTSEDDFILEKDITIDNDEVESEIEFNFDLDKVLDEEINGELELFCRLIYQQKDLASKVDTKFIIRTSGGQR